ncbi:oxidoreductase [Maribellus sediminis]|uniref:oxidoreductase n=1 Tax=Maribellus sediminis TaxID=2696285 RepID=UPI0014311635|nr:oxidoreductase [Maribellus sediminis]
MKKFSFLLLITLLLLGCQNNSISVKAEFAKLEANSEASLRGLFVVDENVIWASGSGGTILLSTDSGESWKEMKVQGAEENDFRSIYARDKNHAIVFGIAGPDFGYSTTNGGESWEVVYRDTTAGLFFNSLKFADDRHGLAVSDPIEGKFFVIRTEDGGATWQRVESLPPVEEGEANFAASNTCIEFLPSGKAWIASGGKAARVFYSEDFGLTWDVAKTPMIRGTASSGIFSVAFQNDKAGAVVGGIYDQPEINTNIAAYTVDGGKNWLSSETMPAEYRSCVQSVKSGTHSFLFAIGKTGCDVSTDGGQNWNFVSEDGYYTFRAVPGELSGFAAGSEGRIAKISFGHQ